MGIVLAFKDKDIRGRATGATGECEESVEWDLERGDDTPEPGEESCDTLDAALGRLFDGPSGAGAGPGED